ncbi:hypothetical protein BC828DRAFT_386994 [Blastocladiella britannica]|nr:hypothetical protein BC828DRAFT_386994 [Blastocladiella britannica]
MSSLATTTVFTSSSSFSSLSSHGRSCSHPLSLPTHHHHRSLHCGCSTPAMSIDKAAKSAAPAPCLKLRASRAATPPTIAGRAARSFLADLNAQHARQAAYCRDFLCCGLFLSDLFELLEHFEDQHVHSASPSPTISTPLASATGALSLSPIPCPFSASVADGLSIASTNASVNQYRCSAERVSRPRASHLHPLSSSSAIGDPVSLSPWSPISPTTAERFLDLASPTPLSRDGTAAVAPIEALSPPRAMRTIPSSLALLPIPSGASPIPSALPTPLSPPFVYPSARFDRPSQSLHRAMSQYSSGSDESSSGAGMDGKRAHLPAPPRPILIPQQQPYLSSPPLTAAGTAAASRAGSPSTSTAPELLRASPEPVATDDECVSSRPGRPDMTRSRYGMDRPGNEEDELSDLDEDSIGGALSRQSVLQSHLRSRRTNINKGLIPPSGSHTGAAPISPAPSPPSSSPSRKRRRVAPPSSSFSSCN